MDQPNTSLKSTGQDFAKGEELHVFTTARWDPLLLESAENTAASCNRVCPIYLLEHHWTRLQVAKWSTSFARGSPADLLRNLMLGIKQWSATNPGQNPKALRIKHRVYASGRITTEITPEARIPLSYLFPTTFDQVPDRPESEYWTVTLDTVATEISATTMYKTGDRYSYDRARSAAGIKSYSEPKEVLLYNLDNEIMDGSITTAYFYRNGQWITPASAAGGQQGTTRRWALQRGLCIEGTVQANELQDGEVLWLSNAVRGYYKARFVARTMDGDGVQRVER